MSHSTPSQVLLEKWTAEKRCKKKRFYVRKGDLSPFASFFGRRHLTMIFFQFFTSCKQETHILLCFYFKGQVLGFEILFRLEITLFRSLSPESTYAMQYRQQPVMGFDSSHPFHSFPFALMTHRRQHTLGVAQKAFR